VFYIDSACNQFGSQEPGTDDDIVTFCKTKYDVHFPILEKVEVNGDNVHPLYQWLKEQKSQLLMSRIKWNFEKFLIDKNGNVRERYSSVASPEGLEEEIEKLLKE
jgi:glutathione peroxidase